MATTISRINTGSATPYLAIFDNAGKPIIDPLTSLPIGTFVSNFFYEYNEEDEDKAEITLEMANANIIDVRQLGIQSRLRLQWGWIFPNGSSESSSVRKVIIRDYDLNFSDNGVRIVLKCTDSFALTKMKPSDLREQTFHEWVKANLSGDFMFEMIDNNVKNKLYIKDVTNNASIDKQRNK